LHSAFQTILAIIFTFLLTTGGTPGWRPEPSGFEEPRLKATALHQSAFLLRSYKVATKVSHYQIMKILY